MLRSNIKWPIGCASVSLLLKHNISPVEAILLSDKALRAVQWAPIPVYDCVIVSSLLFWIFLPCGHLTLKLALLGADDHANDWQYAVYDVSSNFLVLFMNCLVHDADSWCGCWDLETCLDTEIQSQCYGDFLLPFCLLNCAVINCSCPLWRLMCHVHPPTLVLTFLTFWMVLCWPFLTDYK